MGLVVCKDHKAALTPADLITDEGWAMIDRDFLAKGLAPLDRGSVELDCRLLYQA